MRMNGGMYWKPRSTMDSSAWGGRVEEKEEEEKEEEKEKEENKEEEEDEE